MKRLILIAMLLAMMSAALPADAGEMSPREGVINFRGALLDEGGLPFDGTVDAEAIFYGDPSRDAGSLLYREDFDDVAVSRGIVSLPLLDGEAEEGSAGSVIGAASDDVYVDVAIGGTLMVELHPLGSRLSAIRAEEADVAYGLKEDIELANSDIPTHGAQKVTSGTLDQARLPGGIPASRFGAGSLSSDRLPEIPASKVTGGVFSGSVIPDVLDAGIFTSGTISDDVLPSDIVTRDDVYVSSGTVGHLGVIPIPTGYTRDHCQWVVGIHDLDGSGGVDQFQVYSDHNGVVTCRWSPMQADSELNHFCVASYLLVCMR